MALHPEFPVRVTPLYERSTSRTLDQLASFAAKQRRSFDQALEAEPSSSKCLAYLAKSRCAAGSSDCWTSHDVCR